VRFSVKDARRGGFEGIVIEDACPTSLVVILLLDDRWALDRVLLEKRLETAQLDRLVTTLVRFYRRTPSISSKLRWQAHASSPFRKAR
jgi:hypothetical protein